MQISRWFLVVSLTGCSQPPPAAPLTRDGALRAASHAYAVYCGVCPDIDSCCLTGADFAARRWSPASGAYLRAMREYYECMLGDTLIESNLYDDSLPVGDPLQRPLNSIQSSCRVHSCMAAEVAMAEELDHALAAPIVHQPGAFLACSPK